MQYVLVEESLHCLSIGAVAEEEGSIGLEEGEDDSYREEEEEGENDLVVLDPSHVRLN